MTLQIKEVSNKLSERSKDIYGQMEKNKTTVLQEVKDMFREISTKMDKQGKSITNIEKTISFMEGGSSKRRKESE